ncbi:unnamed protein product [Ceratitis capitata]|uniref:(Mediterranean fruit fly) hypothetical protein n=1 Tax=Ceratitis capitata TaxID=7213 RepID=A0A811V1T2_CERCA|nr:unnamed protein product [Ceratitis capitata]
MENEEEDTHDFVDVTNGGNYENEFDFESMSDLQRLTQTVISLTRTVQFSHLLICSHFRRIAAGVPTIRVSYKRVGGLRLLAAQCGCVVMEEYHAAKDAAHGYYLLQGVKTVRSISKWAEDVLQRRIPTIPRSTHVENSVIKIKQNIG